MYVAANFILIAILKAGKICHVIKFLIILSILTLFIYKLYIIINLVRNF